MKYVHRYSSAFLIAGFVLLSVIVAACHEIWLDEAYHYLLPREAATFSALVRNGSVSGHPVLWNILLFCIRPFAPGIGGMQALHVLLGATTVSLIVLYSPFSKGECALIAFGYYFFYEYNIIAKNYAIGFLLLFLSLTLFQRKNHLLLPALLCGAAANTHLFTLFVACGLYLFFRHQRAAADRTRIAADIIFMVALAVAVIQIIPATEVIQTYRAYDVPEILSPDRLARSLALPARGLFNVPDFRTESFWNSNIFFSLSHLFTIVLSLFACIVIFTGFRRHRSLLALYFLPTGAIMVFVYFAPLATGVRYWGYSYVLLILCTWLLRSKEAPEAWFRRFFASLLMVQCCVTVPMVITELRRPFSNARGANAAISQTGYGHLVYFVRNISSGPSLSAYSGKPVYYPGSGKFATYDYDKQRSLKSEDEFLSASVASMRRLSTDSCLLCSNQELLHVDPLLLRGYHLTSVARLTGAIIGSENYFIYLLSEQ